MMIKEIRAKAGMGAKRKENRTFARTGYVRLEKLFTILQYRSILNFWILVLCRETETYLAKGSDNKSTRHLRRWKVARQSHNGDAQLCFRHKKNL